MRMGGFDGYGDVYEFTARRASPSGSTTIAVTPRLHDGESLEDVFPRVHLRLRGAGARRFSGGAGGYPGKGEDRAVYFEPRLKPGTLFVTSQRLIFLRRQIDWKEGFLRFKHGTEDVGAPDGVPSDVLACGGIEYCEMMLDDITGLEKDVLGWQLRLEVRGRSYILRLTSRQAEAVSRLARC